MSRRILAGPGRHAVNAEKWLERLWDDSSIAPDVSLRSIVEALCTVRVPWLREMLKRWKDTTGGCLLMQRIRSLLVMEAAQRNIPLDLAVEVLQ